MTVVTPMTAVDMSGDDTLVTARAAAAAFPDAPLAMPVQDMSPATVWDVLHDMLPAVLRRRLSRGPAIRN